jgi:hypothetical protein
LGVLTEAIFDTYESGKTFEEREPLAVLRAAASANIGHPTRNRPEAEMN